MLKLSSFLGFSETVENILNQNKGKTVGFDFLRLFLALLVFYSHSGWILSNIGHATPDVVNYTSFQDVSGIRSLKHTFYAMVVPMFFALSGFLVAASAERNRNVSVFLAHRGLRIFPALTVEIFLSALVLGPIFTSLNLSQYFTSEVFFRYFGNIFGFVAFYLPGVFEKNPVDGVINTNLWTLPAEFYCYLILSLFMVSGLLWKKAVISVLFILCSTYLLIHNLVLDKSILNGEHFHAFFIVYYFIVGVIFFVWRKHIRINIYLFLGALCLGAAFLAVRKLTVFSPIFIVYITVAIGLCKIPFPHFLRKNDYSYGVYLYGFPICQALYASCPWLSQTPRTFAALALMLTLAFAAFSWHVFELKALSYKKTAQA
jgi:peptidoglycan/LPS O-acetylase OafA/YrhL